MMQSAERRVRVVAAALRRECAAVPRPATAGQRAVRRKYSRHIRHWSDAAVLAARRLLESGGERWLAYELVAHHPGFDRLRDRQVEALGRGIDSWWTVDAFARIVSGPAWLRGRIADRTVRRWAVSKDLWWRRAALVSTVALNRKTDGGSGDAARTLRICRLLVGDHADMVVKGMSWALRELVAHDAEAVRAFLDRHGNELAARVHREVSNKLRTGLKNPGTIGPGRDDRSRTYRRDRRSPAC